ncbi:hypothetical protein NMY22_g1201 [Coprinellus aureogranulatus]|nr:hypothetical protein NMY22_g1201 [Coprinellus aureogranulatus]
MSILAESPRLMSNLYLKPKLPAVSPAEVATAMGELSLDNALTSQETLVDTRWPAVRRRLGDTEASYYLPSRESGVNDMYLMLGFNAAPETMVHSRVRTAWAILRCRHPLLASAIEMENYEDIFFSYRAPRTSSAAVSDADAALEHRTQTSEGKSFRLSQTTGEISNVEATYDLLICATHFLGDGMALHQFAHEFLSLLGTYHEVELLAILETEIGKLSEKYSKQEDTDVHLPLSLEGRLPPSSPTRINAAASLVEHLGDQRRQIARWTLLPKEKIPRTQNHRTDSVV